MRNLTVLILLALTTAAFAGSPDVAARPDSLDPSLPVRNISPPDTNLKPNALGLDLMIGNSGFGLGFS